MYSSPLTSSSKFSNEVTFHDHICGFGDKSRFELIIELFNLNCIAAVGDTNLDNLEGFVGILMKKKLIDSRRDRQWFPRNTPCWLQTWFHSYTFVLLCPREPYFPYLQVAFYSTFRQILHAPRMSHNVLPIFSKRRLKTVNGFIHW